MAYQIKKSNRITEELELLGDDNTVAMTLHVDIDAEKIARDYRQALIALTEAEKAAKEENTAEVLETYGKAILRLIQLVFGKENTEKLVEYFDGGYIDMLGQTMPFICDVIAPGIQKSVQQHKQIIANNADFSRRQRRKLKLK